VHLVASVRAVLQGFGVGVGSGEIPAFASDGDTRGCRLPPWGRHHGSDCSSPHRAPGETLDPDRIGRRRHHDVAPFLKASPWLLRWSLERWMASMLAPAQSVSLRSAMYTVVKLLRRCHSRLIGSCCLLADSFRRL
jgi:hypothetical protein